MRASLSDQLKLKVRTLHGDIKASLATHPVNFDDVWHLAGYSRKDAAKRCLKGPGIDGEILFHRSVENSTTPSLEEVRRGRPSERILMTVRAFKHFCMNAPTEQGQAIRDYYITLEESVSEVLEGVRRGEISIKPTTSAGAKRLFNFSNAIDITTKKRRTYADEEVAETKRIADTEQAIMARRHKLEAEINRITKEAAHDIQTLHEKRTAHENRKAAIKLERARLEQKHSRLVAAVPDAAEATFDAMRAELEAKLESDFADQKRAWIEKMKAHGAQLDHL